MTLGYSEMMKLAECDYKLCLLSESEFPDEYAVRGAVYHLQQAVEKMLRAVIIFHGEIPEFSNDIYRLIQCCKRLGEAFSDNSEDIADTLILWKVKSRYEPYVDFTAEKYGKAKKLYAEICEKVNAQSETAYQIDSQSSNCAEEDEGAEI